MKILLLFISLLISWGLCYADSELKLGKIIDQSAEETIKISNRMDSLSVNNNEYIRSYNLGVIDARKQIKTKSLKITGFMTGFLAGSLGTNLLANFMEGDSVTVIPENVLEEAYKTGYNDMCRNIKRNVARSYSASGSPINYALGIWISVVITVIFVKGIAHLGS